MFLTASLNAQTVKLSHLRLELVVDGQRKSSEPTQRSNKHIDLTDTLYIGGIQLKKKSRAIRQGLKSGSMAMLGCLKDLELEGRRIGLPEVLETQDIRPGCQWEFPCESLGPGPCLSGESCNQEGLTSFSCLCSRDSCSEDIGSPTSAPAGKRRSLHII